MLHPKSESILIIRLGAMGDILHALPAAASLRRGFPDKRIVWITKPKWLPLLEGNPSLDEIILFDRGSWRTLLASAGRIRAVRPVLAFDFQGLVQSALVGRWARPERYWGFSRSIVREPLASLFYSDTAAPPGPHRLERNLQLIRLAGATSLTNESWIPHGRREGDIPSQPFVLANPFAGWAGKQWPLDAYQELGRRLNSEGFELVLNVSPQQGSTLGKRPHLRVHVSSLSGLIHATRCASAVVGVDSGPLHLAAALRKPGVAIFGPTDPASHGPYGGSMVVLRSAEAATTYNRRSESDPSMQAISVESVYEALHRSLRAHSTGAVSQS